jgi:hypothetical protein
MASGIIGLVIYIGCIAGSATIGSRKGRPVLGIVLGIVLSLIGLIIMAVIPSKRARY